MPGIHPFDIAVIVLYLVGITALGIWTARRVKNLSDFFMPRRFGKGMMIMHAFGTGTASDQAVTVAAATFKGGLSGIWYQWLWLFVTPFYWLIAPVFRRFRAVTTADVYELRFDRSVAVLFALVGIANMSVKIGLMLKGAGVLIESATGTYVDTELAILAVTVMFVLYGAAGGLAAAIVTDYAQGLLTILFSVMLLPFVLSAVGGMQGVRETITDPHMLSLVAPGKVTWFFVIMMSLQALVGIVAQPFIMGVCAAGKTEWEGRIGFTVGNLVKRICTIAWSLTAIAAVAWYLQRGVDLASVQPDHIYGDVAQAFLPKIAPGVLGLFLAAVLAGVMSSCDAFMVSSAALFTENVYKPAVPGRTERHYVWIGRLTSVMVVAGGVIFALWVPTVVKALEIWFMIAPMMGLVFWIGLLWRRLTVVGAWVTTLSGFATWWITTQSWFIDCVRQTARRRGMASALGGERQDLAVSALADPAVHDCGGRRRRCRQPVYAARVAGQAGSLLHAQPHTHRARRTTRQTVRLAAFHGCCKANHVGHVCGTGDSAALPSVTDWLCRRVDMRRPHDRRIRWHGLMVLANFARKP